MDFASPSGFSVRVKCHSFGGWRSQKAAGGFTTHWDDDAQGRFNEKGWFIIEKVEKHQKLLAGNCEPKKLKMVCNLIADPYFEKSLSKLWTNNFVWATQSIIAKYMSSNRTFWILINFVVYLVSKIIGPRAACWKFQLNCVTKNY